MDIIAEVDFLRKTPLFRNVELAKLKLLAFTSERLVYQPGQVVFKEGDIGDAAYLVLDGEARVTVDSPRGQQEVGKVRTHEIVGELAILCDAPRIATVTAESELTTLRISKEFFLSLLEEFPTIAMEVIRELAKRLQLSNSKLQDIQLRKLIE